MSARRLSLDRRKTRLETVSHTLSACVSRRSVLTMVIPIRPCLVARLIFATHRTRANGRVGGGGVGRWGGGGDSI